MNKVTMKIQGEVPWCKMFADDTVLVSKNVEEVNNSLDEWRLALEWKGLSRSNYIDYEFGEETIGEVESFKYLARTISSPWYLKLFVQKAKKYKT